MDIYLYHGSCMYGFLYGYIFMDADLVILFSHDFTPSYTYEFPCGSSTFSTFHFKIHPVSDLFPVLKTCYP